MKHFYTSILFALISISSIAQFDSADSLKIVLKDTHIKRQRLELLESLNKILISSSTIEDALPYFTEMSVIAKELENDTLETRAYNYISEVYVKKMDSVNALRFSQKALEIDKGNNNLGGYLLDINQLGRVYHHFQFYDKAISVYQEGILKYTKEQPKEIPTVLSNLYSNLSVSYQMIGKSEESIVYILKGVELAEKLNNANQKSYGLYLLGYRYMELENYEKAEEYYFKSLTYSDNVSLQVYVNSNHHGLGINYSRWGKYDKALYHNNKALEFFRLKGDKLYEFDVLNNIAVVYQRLDKQDSIIKYANIALSVAEEINHKLAISGAKLTLTQAHIALQEYNKAEELLLDISKDTIDVKVINANSKVSIYSNLSEVYEGQQKYARSLDFHKRFKRLNDSIQKEKLESKFEDIESKYQLEQKNNKILSQSLALNKKDEQRNKLWYLISIISCSILFLSYLLFNKNRALKEENKKYLKEVEKVKKIEKRIKEKSESLKIDSGEQEKLFYKFLMTKYFINAALVEYWKLQAHGVKEKEMAKKLHISLSAVESRRTRLYGKIKDNEGIETAIRFSKSDSVRVFRENEAIFFL